ncbi:ankyrin repeat domain-containing protein, partial [Planctomycetota bacterium]
KYKQAAMDAIKYAFENLRSPNGLLYWGMHAAYDAAADKPCGSTTRHVFKGIYPYYELMYEVDSEVTREFIESFWAAHIRDWSNLDMDRIGSLDRLWVAKGWDNEYKGGPVFFESIGSMSSTASDLLLAAAVLTKYSGDTKPFLWGKRIVYRYVETRDPNTGFPAWLYTGRFKKAPTRQELKDFGFDPEGQLWFPLFLPSVDPEHGLRFYSAGLVSDGIPFNITMYPSICDLLVGEMMGLDGRELIQWTVEDLTAWGRVAYRKDGNLWIPMLLNGTSLEDVVINTYCGLGPKGTVVKPGPVIPMDFWAYALAYRLTEDSFLWQMVRNIALGSGFGDVGTPSGGLADLRYNTDCFDPFALMGFLELYKKTQNSAFLRYAEQIGNNLLTSRFHKGFFVPSSKHIYTRFNTPESLVLLHLYATRMSRRIEVPIMFANQSPFECEYRHKYQDTDTKLIYTLTDFSEPPLSLQEAAAIGDLDLVRSLIEEGAMIDGTEETYFVTALHRAATNGHKDAVELLLEKGADTEAKDSFSRTALYYASENGHIEIVKLLTAHGADVNTKDLNGQTPLDIAFSRGYKDIAALLLSNGAKSSIHIAAWIGDLATIKTFLEEGIDVNKKDARNMNALHYAAREGHKEMVELLLANGAEINAGASYNRTAAQLAMENNHSDIVELLISKGADVSPLHLAIHMKDEAKARSLIEGGADVNKKTQYGTSPLLIAVGAGLNNIVELLIDKGADVNAKDNWNWTPLHSAAYSNKDIAELKGMVELLIARGADVNAKDGDGNTPLWHASKEGHTEIVEILRKHGAKE